MAKDSRHPFLGQEVILPTKHQKEIILAPLFAELGLSLKVAEVDTDLFGTFSGEVERVGTIREALRAKINAAIKCHPNARFFVASEGSFAPHPYMGLFQSDLESLLFFDKLENTEIYEEFISTDVVHDEVTVSHLDELKAFLKRNKFPFHALILRPSELFDPIFKAIETDSELKKAFIECFINSQNGKVTVATDLRSHCNPTRQKVIQSVGRKLIETLKSLCPKCHYPGFKVVNGIPGLPCRDCGQPSGFSYKVSFECVQCSYSEERERPDGILSIGPEECERCNP